MRACVRPPAFAHGRQHVMNFSGVREDRFRAPLVPPSPPKYGTSPQFGASTLKFEHTTSLDSTFNKLVFDVQQRLHLVAKAPRIRLETWLRKLHEPVRATCARVARGGVQNTPTHTHRKLSTISPCLSPHTHTRNESLVRLFFSFSREGKMKKFFFVCFVRR